MNIVPKEINQHVQTLCSRLAPKEKAFYLAVEPAPEARPLDCYQNVDRQVTQHGGEVVHGWQIWSALNLYVSCCLA